MYGAIVDKPAPPRNLCVKEINPNYITLQWNTPDEDGGAPITGYVIEKADAKRRTFAAAGNTDADTLVFKATKLYEGSEYLFKVFAENAVGLSEPATLPEPVTAKLPFGESRLIFHLVYTVLQIIIPHRFTV